MKHGQTSNSGGQSVAIAQSQAIEHGRVISGTDAKIVVGDKDLTQHVKDITIEDATKLHIVWDEVVGIDEEKLQFVKEKMAQMGNTK